MINRLKNLKFEDLILYEDNDFLAINKPPSLSTLADRSSKRNVLDLAKVHWSEIKVCHRLDKETSGVLMLSKNLESYKYFSKLLENREVSKVYHALIAGRHEIDEEINWPLTSSSNRTFVDPANGKKSWTFVKTLYIYHSHTLLACMPVTGRMHQIRVHLANGGHPICGDQLYGGTPIFLSDFKKKYKIGKYEEEKPLMPRLALHAESLAFVDRNDQEIKVQAPHPKDFEVTLKQLAKNM